MHLITKGDASILHTQVFIHIDYKFMLLSSACLPIYDLLIFFYSHRLMMKRDTASSFSKYLFLYEENSNTTSLLL